MGDKQGDTSDGLVIRLVNRALEIGSLIMLPIVMGWRVVVGLILVAVVGVLAGCIWRKLEAGRSQHR